LLYVVVVAVLDVSVLSSSHVVGVLFREDFLVLNWLHRCVVVVLVDLAINGFGNVLMLSASYVLIGDGWVDGLNVISDLFFRVESKGFTRTS
jgi:hypothetical protein